MEFTEDRWDLRGRHCWGFLAESSLRYLPYIYKRNIALIHGNEGDCRCINRIPGKTKNGQIVIVLIENRILFICSITEKRPGYCIPHVKYTD